MGAVTKEDAFETLHTQQLARALGELRNMGSYDCWRIALYEPLLMAPPSNDDDVMESLTIAMVEVKLTPDREHLMVANEGSQRAIDEWEKRNGVDPCLFPASD
jgi:hypothetical protein